MISPKPNLQSFSGLVKAIIKILLGIVAVFAWAIIGLDSDDIAKQSRGVRMGHPLLVLFSFIYLHWLLRSALMPLSHLSSHEAQKLMDRAAPYYSKSLFLATICLGYFFLYMHCLVRIHSTESSYIMEALVLVTVGTIMQARGLIKFLTIEGPDSVEEFILRSATPASPQPTG